MPHGEPSRHRRRPHRRLDFLPSASERRHSTSPCRYARESYVNRPSPSHAHELHPPCTSRLDRPCHPALSQFQVASALSTPRKYLLKICTLSQAHQSAMWGLAMSSRLRSWIGRTLPSLPGSGSGPNLPRHETIQVNHVMIGGGVGG